MKKNDAIEAVQSVVGGGKKKKEKARFEQTPDHLKSY